MSRIERLSIAGYYGFQDRVGSQPQHPPWVNLVAGEGFEPVTAMLLRHVPPTVGLTGHMVRAVGFEPTSGHALRVLPMPVWLRSRTVPGLSRVPRLVRRRRPLPGAP